MWFLSGQWFGVWLLDGWCYVQSPNWKSYLFENSISTKLQATQYFTCGIWLLQLFKIHLIKTSYFLSFPVKENIYWHFLANTWFFPSGDWCLPKRVNFRPCVVQFLLYVLCLPSALNDKSSWALMGGYHLQGSSKYSDSTWKTLGISETWLLMRGGCLQELVTNRGLTDSNFITL